MIRGRDGDGVKVISQLGEHLAKIGVVRQSRILDVDAAEARAIDITQGDELGLGVRSDFQDIGMAFAAATHCGNLDLRVEVAGSDQRREG